jgi:predicted AlkP superfamily pyrophosphatase or phosphodiesterase
MDTRLDRRTRPRVTALRLTHLAVLLIAMASALTSGCGRADRGLIVVISVDQLGASRLSTVLPGGLGRLAREGRVFTAATLPHAITHTCPGHVSLVTGRSPGPIGIPANTLIDGGDRGTVYCVEDSASDAAVHGESEGRSPRRMRATALGDWLTDARPGARVFSVAGKDRSAIVMGGQGAEAAYWLAGDDPLRMTSSRYYMPSLPEWVVAANAGLARGLPARWDHGTPLPETGEPPPGRADDYRGEDDKLGRTSSHPILESGPGGLHDRVAASPFADQLVLDFAAELIEREGLGVRQVDLLLVGLSATDIIGHAYGPESHEAADARVRLDAKLAAWLERLERHTDGGTLIVALSADHGVLPLPEWLADTGRATCPVPGGGRVLTLGLLSRLSQGLAEAFPGDGGLPELHLSWPQIAVSRASAATLGIDPAAVLDVIERELEAEPSIARVWRREEILDPADASEMARLYRASFDPSSGVDLVAQVAEGCLVTSSATGTSHGSPYVYDRAVPLVLWGTGVAPGQSAEPVTTLDLAPTVAGLLGVPVPAEVEGRDLLPRQSRPE